VETSMWLTAISHSQKLFWQRIAFGEGGLWSSMAELLLFIYTIFCRKE